ncbi:MAG: Tad domain-containing protein [Chromatiales bacterium]
MLILLVTVIAVLIGLSLVNTGILTSEKMQLQNAADATAYSISTIEARDLNFTAYTNRAMVANEVAMAQMVGLMSWAAMAKSTPKFLDLYFSPLYAVPILGTIIKAVIQGLNAVFTFVEGSLVKPFTKVGSKFVPYFNRVYSTSQRFMHLATLYFSGMTLFDMIDANADDANLSLYGYLMLARHLNTYYGDLDILKKYDSFVTSYRQDDYWNKAANFNIPHLISEKPKSDAQKKGMERLAALINASRDPFSTNRDCSQHPVFSFICNDDGTGGWTVPLFPRIHFSINIRDPIFGFCITCVSVDFTVGLERHGGSDLRYTKKSGEQHYIWTAGDATGIAVNLDIDVILFEIDLGIPDLHADLPFGLGGAQAGTTTDQATLAKRTMIYHGIGGKTEDHMYGQAPGILPISWVFPGPVPAPGVALSAQQNNINTSYHGLPRYNDTKTGPDPIKIDSNLKFGFEAPYLLIGLVKDIGDVKQSPSTGRFALDPNTANDVIAVIGKSEVYFSRPNDLGYFARSDGKTELANGFNPYWDARLVDTSYLDRTSALAVQQLQPWLPQNITLVLTQLQNLLSFLP